MSEAVAVAGKRRQPLVEYVPSAFMALMGVIVLIDASTLSNNRTGVDPIGPRAVPIVVGVVSLILAVALAVTVRRGHLAEAESGEDIDLEHKADLKTVLMLIGVFVANILLIDTLGWVISGGLLFYGSAVALGSRHFIRDLFIAAGLSLGTFYAFAIGLGVNLPAGILQGIL
jgi:putative tricarboxylic transport membrane protein